jgi:methanogenesis imperfect marker protein 11
MPKILLTKYSVTKVIRTLENPYSITYPKITAIGSESGQEIELIEQFDCVGGAMWAKTQYQKSPLVTSVRTVADTNRYILNTGNASLHLQGSVFPAGISEAQIRGDEIFISYLGLGGGGVGAAICRASAGGVIRSDCTESGGGKEAGSMIVLANNTRVLIGVDDTDTAEAGATWTLVHNIARTISTNNHEHNYLSHTIVQLYPVEFRTKNCVALVVEFATTSPSSLIDQFSELLNTYTLSPDTGMAVFIGFSPNALLPYGWRVKQGYIGSEDTIAQYSGNTAVPGLSVSMSGRGLVGAIAAIPFYTRFEEALQLCG